jgi:hypothetical protein
MMGAALTIFSGPYAMFARMAVVAIILVSAFGTGWVKGNQHGTKKLTDYQGAQAVESIKVVTRQGEVTEREVTKYVNVAGKTKVVTETIEKEVTKYVDSKPLALACMLDNRWVRLHDAAALGTVPPAASADDATAGTVSAAQALPGITSNYAAGNRTADRLEALQGWVREQYKATNGKTLGY